MEEQQIYTVLICFWFAVFGAVLGSFLDCAVSRKKAGEPPFAGRSHCGSCGHVLGVPDLIPVFSFLLRLGKCKYCGKPIPRDCLLSEIAGALALGCVGFRFGPMFVLGLMYGFSGPAFALVQWIIWAALLFALSLTDAYFRIIPDKLLFVLAANRAVWFFAVETDFTAAGFAVLKALAIPAALLVLVLLWEKFSDREVMGGGDIKLLFVLALYLTWGQMLLTLLVSCLFGVVWAILARQKRGVAFAFGPFLAAGAIAAVCFGEPVLTWYLSLL